MEIYWGFGLATVAILVILCVSVYLAVRSDFFEVEFKAFPPMIRVVAEKECSASPGNNRARSNRKGGMTT